MENMAFTMNENWPNYNYDPFSIDFIKGAIENPDKLFVFAFHPLHIALNTNNFRQYQSVKEKILEANTSPFSMTFKGKGTRDFFEILISENVKVEVVKVDGDEKKARSESEQIAIEEEKMKTLETLEEDEATMK